jgi:hypothetical protein
MARVSNFKFNPGYFGELGRSPAVVAILVKKANAVAATARSTAGVDTGRYKAGIKVSTRQAAYRTVAVVTATDEKSLIIESKTGNLARALKTSKKA